MPQLPSPPPPQGKAIEDSFSGDQNSTWRTAGQVREEAVPCPDHIFPILEVRRLPSYIRAKGFCGGQKGSDDKRCSTFRPFR